MPQSAQICSRTSLVLKKSSGLASLLHVLLCVTSFDRLPRACAKRFAALIRRAQSEGARVVCLTPQPLYGVAYHDFGSGEVRCYNIDASTMKTMLRANNGMVLLEEGVIRAKKNCRDIRP